MHDKAILDHPAVTEVLFYPRRLGERDIPQLPHGSVETVPVGAETRGAYRFQPHEKGPTVLFFHGNGEVMTDALHQFHEDMASAGANLFVVDYRGYGLSAGSPSLSRLLDDARAGWDHAVDGLGLSPGEIVIMGRSLGSLAALEVAAGPGRDAKGLILESGIARFDHWVDRMGMVLQTSGVDLTGLRTSLQAHFDHEAKLKAFPGPTLILHTEHDEIVPVENGRFFEAWGHPTRTTAHFFPRGGHNDIQWLNREDYFQRVGGFLRGL
ncbi:MAG: alpha/beta hydrolase [Planctomycetota bacterium]|jgi:pimeloyl-ACP methyl ester carboxylesterase